MAVQNGSSNADKLPASTSPTLRLVKATPEQARECWALNGIMWRGSLSEDAYTRREQHLADQPLTTNGGVTYWILIDEADTSSNPTILSSCETFRKKAFVARKDSTSIIEEITSHGIGSVFCREEFRGRGYAGRMMEELAKALKTWQQKAGKDALFNVLYSDIGKQFYAKRGWRPFPSSHVSLLGSARTTTPDGPAARPLYSSDLPSLCDADIAQLKRNMSTFKDSPAKVKVAFIPDVETIQWQHSREEFLAEELYQRRAEIKGAIVGSEPGKRIWCIWLRNLHKNPAERTFYITRLVIEGSSDPLFDVHTNGTNGNYQPVDSKEQIDGIAACLKAAQLEAARWDIEKVELWNPAAVTLHAARQLQSDAELIHREEDSIASLLWYGSEISPEELAWVNNEKYGWC